MVFLSSLNHKLLGFEVAQGLYKHPIYSYSLCDHECCEIRTPAATLHKHIVIKMKFMKILIIIIISGSFLKPFEEPDSDPKN